VLPALARAPWKRLRQAARRAGADTPDDELHRIRVLAKRARYAADVAALVLGNPAARFAAAAADVQDVLGGHQDAVLAEAWLREAVRGQSADSAFAAGQLVWQQRADAEHHRRAFPDVWQKLDRGKVRAWMSP